VCYTASHKSNTTRISVVCTAENFSPGRHSGTGDGDRKRTESFARKDVVGALQSLRLGCRSFPESMGTINQNICCYCREKSLKRAKVEESCRCDCYIQPAAIAEMRVLQTARDVPHFLADLTQVTVELLARLSSVCPFVTDVLWLNVRS